MATPSIDLLIRRLDSTGSLSAVERMALGCLEGTPVSVNARTDFGRAGDRPRCVHVLLEGFAYRYALLPEGKRQITFFHIPGDILDLPALFLTTIDYDLCSVVRSQLLAIPHEAILSLFQEHPQTAHLFWRETLIHAAIFREWMIGMGRRQALARAAHLFCELIVRMQAVGLADDHAIALPLTQADLGDALGLSAVHVNRTLQELRGAGLIKLTRGRLEAIDWDRLCEAADFDPRYLHEHQIGPGAARSL